MTTDEAMVRLKKGNDKYLLSLKNDSDISPALREDTSVNGQHPYAVVVTCSDSLVVPEDIFMTGLGELYVVRVAGNVVAESQLASIEYAVETLHCPLVLVLGHTKCDLINAAISGNAEGRIKVLTDGILKAIGSEKNDYKAACLNVEQSVNVISSNLHVDNEEFLVQGAVYDVEDGHVDWL